MKIYLSPSNQPHNTYTGVDTNEKAEMEGVAHRVKTLIERDYAAEVVMASLSMGINKSERPTECKNKGCDLYFALHSNAGGNGKAAGAVGFYQPNAKNTKELATALVKELNAIAPVKSNRSVSVINGMNAFNGQGYGEIRSPMQLGIPSVLFEVNFHDNATIAKWIVATKDTIATAIVKALVDTYGIKKKQSENKPEEKTLYRVQTGAFSKKENADALAAKLKAAGFDTYIVTVDRLYKVQIGAYSVKTNADDMLKKLKAAGFEAFVTTNSGTATQQPPATPKKSVDEIAKEVIAGKWGNGTERKNRLTAAGYNYQTVQKRVNELLK